MSNIALSVTESNVFASLRLFLLGILPDSTEVIAAQDNRVGEPRSASFITLTPMSRGRLSTNVNSHANDLLAQSLKRTQATQIVIQLDVHGPGSADLSQIISTLFRDEYAVEAFAASGYDVAPLFATDPKQIPFMNAEQQFEDRWVIEMNLQANPALTLPQEFAKTMSVELIEVDAEFPP